MLKELTCNAGDSCLIPESGRSPGEGMATHSSILAREFHGQRSLAGYSYKIHIAPALRNLNFQVDYKADKSKYNQIRIRRNKIYRGKCERKPKKKKSKGTQLKYWNAFCEMHGSVRSFRTFSLEDL